MALFNSCKEIAYKIRTASCDKMACFNEFGDEQLAIDILANNVLFQVRRSLPQEKGRGPGDAASKRTMRRGVLAVGLMSFAIRPWSVQNLKDSGVVATASSEETPTEDPMGGEGFSVAFDPLDGSSIIDTNFAVGTIFGIWPGSK